MSEFDLQAAAHELRRKVAEERDLQITVRPHNYHDPNSTHWWIIPSTEWPAYRFGKLVLTPKQTDFREPKLSSEDHWLIGLLVESGLKFTASTDHRRTAAEWMWNDFVESVGNGELEQACQHAEQLAGYQVTLWIETSIPDGDSLKKEHYHAYEVRDGQPERPPKAVHVIPELRGVTDWEVIADSLKRITDEKGKWIDVFIGNCWDKTKIGDEASFAGMYSKIEPWLKWFGLSHRSP